MGCVLQPEQFRLKKAIDYPLLLSTTWIIYHTKKIVSNSDISTEFEGLHSPFFMDGSQGNVAM
jgi:hypothetical protein